MSDLIKCPHCSSEFELTESLSSHLRQEVEKEFNQKILEQNKALSAKEEELKKAIEHSQKIQEDVEKQLQEKLEQEKRNLWKLAQEKASEKIREEMKLQMQDQNDQIDQMKKKLMESQELELKLIKEKRELEEAKKEHELMLARKLEAERTKLEEDIRRATQEEQKMKILEFEKKLSDASKANEELKRKLDQGSQQLQGEVLELEIESILNKEFPDDKISEVGKGIRGADLIQVVCDRYGQECGVIVWESKRTKSWTEGWVSKLKEDLLAVRGDIAVLVTDVLPNGVENFGLYNGIWVTDRQHLVGLASAIRSQLSAIHSVKLSAVGKNQKMEILYQYLTGNEFRQRVESIVEAFGNLQSDLEKERKWFMQKWAKQEKNIRRVLDQTNGMYGDLQGMLTLPNISGLALDFDEEFEQEETETIEIEEKVRITSEKKTKQISTNHKEVDQESSDDELTLL